jgi:RsiW-degrading membrane proteinase PrsW (M82 family)
MQTREPATHCTLALSLFFLLACACSPQLAGTNDAELVYVSDPEPQPARGAAPQAPLAAEVKARLVSAQVPADVEALGGDGSGVRIVVDADIAGAVDELVTWRGGLGVFRLDGGYALAPPDTTGLRPMTETAQDGTVDRWWQGSPDAIGRALRQVRIDAAHAAFAERLPNGEARTRVVARPAIVELGLPGAAVRAIDAVERGRALAITLSPEARAQLESERARPGPGSARAGERVALVRGEALLATTALEDVLGDPLVVRFGDDISSYTRAYRTGALLRSPVLPPLRRLAARPLAQRRGLAAACALLPFALSFGWLFFVRRFDRVRPEPMWLVVATFALGCLSVAPAALIELALARASAWLDPSVATLGGQPWALPLAIPVFTVAVGLVEEGAKLLGAWSLAGHRREFDEPVDGIIYGCAAALGFAAVENVKYFALGRMSGAVIALRAFVTVPAHMFFGAIWGYALGQRLVSRSPRLIAFLAAAALAHGCFDAFLSTNGTQLVATVVVLGLGLAFFTLLRRALRHGAVPGRPRVGEDEAPATEPLPPSRLAPRYYRVGSPTAFYACAWAMVFCAFALTVLGSAYELLQHRAGVVFVTLATVMLVLFGAAAYGASATIPLDVGLDARGLTFAGGCTPWAAIRGVSIDPGGAADGTAHGTANGTANGTKRAFVRIETAERSMRLGPATPEVARAIADACARARS